MDVRILDLDGSLTAQPALRRHAPRVVPAREWGPRLRLACRSGRFRRFEQELARHLGPAADDAPAVTLVGSGDFHHVSLALARRQPGPFNLLVLDNHPDWMCGIPFLHCGTWLRHAAALPNVRNVFHVGGDVDFDNRFRWLAPWRWLRTGRVVVLPARRRFQGRPWGDVPHEPLRPWSAARLTARRLDALLRPHRDELARCPLYVSLDKDVMSAADAVVNWDSGHLELAEVRVVLEGFARAAGGRLAGVDVVGDWSPVQVDGWFRRLFHLTEHPPLAVVPEEARRVNERTNLALLEVLRPFLAPRRAQPAGFPA
jgi:arginase family enzyme